ncbi:hypothetical protein [Brevundimonas kwangchunensis]
MNRIDGDVASKIILILGVVLLIAERFWIPAATVFWLGIGFCCVGLGRIKELDQSRTPGRTTGS